MFELEVYRNAVKSDGADVSTTWGFTTIRTFSTTDDYSPFVESTVQLSEIGDNLKENVGSSGYANIYYGFPSGGGFRVTNTSLSIRYADSNTNDYNAETVSEKISSSNGIGILATGSGFNSFWESWCFIKILDNNVGQIIPWTDSFYQYYLPLWYKEDFTWYGTRHYTVGTWSDGSTVEVPIFHGYNVHADNQTSTFLIHTKGELIGVGTLKNKGELRLNNGTVFRYHKVGSSSYFQVGYYDGDNFRPYYSYGTDWIGFTYFETDNPDVSDLRLLETLDDHYLWARADYENEYAAAITGLVVDIHPDVEEPSQYPTGKPGPDPGPTPPSPFPPGTGDYDTSSDTIDWPPLPSIGSPAGFVLWLPDRDTITEFVNYVWSAGFLETFQRGFTSPLEVVLNFHMVPMPVPVAGTGTMSIGSILPPKFEMQYADNQIVEFYLGKIEVTEFYGSLLDYSPYTDIQIYLPYVGLRPLDTDDIMGSTLELRYRIDISNGAGLALLRVTNKSRNLDGVMYQWPCSVSYPVPLYWSAMDGTLKTVQNALAMTATVAVPAAIGAVGGAAAMSNYLASTAPSLSTLGAAGGQGSMLGGASAQLMAGQAAGALPPGPDQMMGHFGRNVIRDAAIDSAAAGAMTAAPNFAGLMPKPDFSPPTGASKSINHQAVSLNDTIGWFGHQRPYLVISRPVLDNPDQYTELLGKPSAYYGPLTSGRGYVKVGACLLPMQQYMSLSQYEEIIRLLGDGVIL